MTTEVKELLNRKALNITESARLLKVHRNTMTRIAKRLNGVKKSNSRVVAIPVEALKKLPEFALANGNNDQ